MKALVFYSSRLDLDHPLSIGLREMDLKLHAESLIEFEALPFTCPSNTEFSWLFFTSPKAVRVYHEHCAFKGFKLAFLGEGTLRAKPEEVHADFVGEGEVAEVAEAFKQVLGHDKVLFPCSKNSLQRIPKLLGHQAEVRFSYETKLKSNFFIPESDLYFFTSPSNVQSFFAKQKPKPGSAIMAMGESTQKELLKFGFPSITPNNYLPESQLKAIKESLKR